MNKGGSSVKGSALGLFLSTTINRIDKKGRVSVPAAFRTALINEAFQGVILFRSYTQRTLEGVGMSAMDEISDRMDNFAFFSEDHDELATALFGESVQLAFDGEGRITLPHDFMVFSGITSEAAFVGLGKKFQIWEPQALEVRKSQARDAVQSKKMILPRSSPQVENKK